MMKLHTTKVEELRRNIRGGLILPSDDAYESARKIWNAMIDKRPALIVRCANTSDVVHAVNFARDNRIVLAVRGGGHNIAGNAMCDDGIVIDLSQMKGASVDPSARRVTIEGGATLGRPRRRHPGPRPRHAARHQLHHRHRRADARRRLRLAQPQVRHDHRQPRVRRGRDRGRRGGARQRRRAPRPLLGAARRQRQFRRRHPLRVPAPPGRPRRAERPDRLSDLRRRSRCCNSTANSSRRRRTISPCGPSCAQAPPLPFLPEEVHGKGIIALALLYAGDPKQGEPLIEPLRKFGTPDRRACRRPALHRLAAGLRSAAHARRAQLLEVAQFLDAQRRAVRRRHRVHREAAVAPVRDLLRRARRRHHTADAGIHGVRSPRCPVRHERPRPLGRPGRRRALHRGGRATSSMPRRRSPAAASTSISSPPTRAIACAPPTARTTIASPR